MDRIYKVEVGKNVVLNGTKLKTFKAWKKIYLGWLFMGEFTAPIKATQKEMTEIVQDADPAIRD